MGIVLFMLVLPVFLKAQIVQNESFKTFYRRAKILRNRNIFEAGSHILPLTLKQKISGLSISGSITFTGEKGFVRIILTDNYDNDYLVLETNSVFEHETDISFEEFCEETALLDNILPKRIAIECTDAQVIINAIQYATVNEYRASIDKQIKEEQLNVKLQHINFVLAEKEITWGAGKTSLSKMTYMEKKNLFGGKLPNLAGFDYYVSGIYVIQGYNSNKNSPQNTTRSQFVSEFDWRNRHGRNWMTSAKNQGSCGSCWAFAAVGTTEAYVNLFYNQLLNLDLSEQDVLSCNNGGTCSGGNTGSALNYIKSTGVVNETCFAYSASDLPCNNKCVNPNEKIKISNYTSFSSYSQTSDDLKKLAIKAPISFGISCWWHALGLTGFKTIQSGDRIYIKTESEDRWVTVTSGHPLVDNDAWILKNSWGTGWGDNGFGYVVTDWSEVYLTYSINGNVASLNYTATDIVCEDRDGDGYYFWGVGTKPAHCPVCAPDEPDGDDSNPNLGPMDEYGNCEAIAPLIENITVSQTWHSNRNLCRNITVQSGVTLTISSTTTVFSSNYTITIQNGGKLILSGGIIDDGNIIAQSGSELTILNNGKILLSSDDSLDIQLDAVFNFEDGEVLSNSNN
jgi:C1A family cysteine protease